MVTRVRKIGLVMAVMLMVVAGKAYGSIAPNKAVPSQMPIEITADHLLLLQKDTQAIFSGKVEAVQGTMRLKADKMIVHYIEKEEQEANGGNAISTVDVSGNVWLSTPKETASGRTGTYDVVGEEVTLEGNVTLTQGQNIVKGGKLTYNLATGQSEMQRHRVRNKDGRVRMLITPTQQPQ